MFEGQLVRAQKANAHVHFSMNWGVFNVIPGKV